MQYSGYTSTICNRAFVAGRSKLVETFMVDVFTATDETSKLQRCPRKKLLRDVTNSVDPSRCQGMDTTASLSSCRLDSLK